MANVDVATFEIVGGFVDKRNGRGLTGAVNFTEINNSTSISAMRTRLAAINAGYFTAARLDTMTRNDMIYALRVHSDTGSI